MILIHKRSEKLFCLALNRPPLVGKSSLWSATNPETELTKARRLLAASVSASEWLWRPESEADEMIENATPQTCYLPCAKSHSDCCFWEGSNSALYLVLREGKERVGGGLGFLQALSPPVRAIQTRGSAQTWFQALCKMVSWHCSNTMAARSQRTFTGLEKPVDGNYWGNTCRIFGPTDRLALGRSLLEANCLYGCESDEENDHTWKSSQSLHSLERQSATGRGQMDQQTGMAELLTS